MINMNQLISDVIYCLFHEHNIVEDYYVETYDKMCWEATGECNAWS